MKTSKKSPRNGFTLIELLTVIAIIGVLTAILIPAVGGARTAAKKAQTRAQFNQYALALQQYRTEYGYWPNIGSVTSGNREIDLSTDYADFVKALTARNIGGTALLDADRVRLNRKATPFLDISENDYIDLGSGDQLADAFSNPQIFVSLDEDNNGQVTRLPDEDGQGTGESITGKIAIWTVKDDAEGFENVQNWN